MHRPHARPGDRVRVSEPDPGATRAPGGLATKVSLRVSGARGGDGEPARRRESREGEQDAGTGRRVRREGRAGAGGEVREILERPPRKVIAVRIIT